MFCIFQKLRLLRRFELRQAVQQHLQDFQLVVQKPRRVVAVNAIAGKKPVNHAIQTLFSVVQEEGKVCKVFVTDSFAYVVVQLHLRRFRVKLKDVPDSSHVQPASCAGISLSRLSSMPAPPTAMAFHYRSIVSFASAIRAACSISAA